MGSRPHARRVDDRPLAEVKQGLSASERARLRATISRFRCLAGGGKARSEDLAVDVLRLLGQYARFRRLEAERRARGSACSRSARFDRRGARRNQRAPSPHRAGAAQRTRTSCLVVDSGMTRLTSSGLTATVWTTATVASEVSSQPVTMHVAGPSILTRGGDRLQVCRSCGVSLSPSFPDGATAFEQGGAFTSARPVGITFRSCQRTRRAATR